MQESAGPRILHQPATGDNGFVAYNWEGVNIPELQSNQWDPVAEEESELTNANARPVAVRVPPQNFKWADNKEKVNHEKKKLTIENHVNSIINIVYIGVYELFRHNMLNIIDEN